MIQQALRTLVNERRDLTEEQAAAAMRQVMAGEATPAQIAALVVALRLKGETAAEVAGMARVMREHALRVPVHGPVVDTCGTGGDGRGTFNISTAAAFVVAAAGVRVAKHGNRAISSSCGSADVLEALGARIDLPPEAVAECVQRVGVGFMFAPVFHPAMRHAAGPRRELGVRTIFNVLGPLTNPAGAEIQVLGVAEERLGPLMADALLRLGSRRALVVHGEDGTDEITTTGNTLAWEVSDGGVRAYRIAPEDVGLSRCRPEDLRGGDAAQNAATLRALLRGENGPLADVVALNAGATLYVSGCARELREGVASARRTMASGEAERVLDRFVEETNRFARD